VGSAWGEAAFLLAAGVKGNRAALPSATIMIKQVRIGFWYLHYNKYGHIPHNQSSDLVLPPGQRVAWFSTGRACGGHLFDLPVVQVTTWLL
jgi:hypothetical protein